MTAAVAPLLELDQVERTYTGRGAPVKALLPSTMSIAPGEIVALVGESGSGKSTLAKVALALEVPDKGRVRLEGRDLFAMSKQELRRHRVAMQPVFQDPTAAFNPRRSIRQVLFEAIACRGDVAGEVEEALPALLGRREVDAEPAQVERDGPQRRGASGR